MNKRGFTLLEVLLFMAVSAALAAIAFIGLRPRIANVQFSTGMRDLESYVNSELSAASLGKNTDDKYRCTANGAGGRIIMEEDASAKAGSQADCVIMGKVLSIGPEGVRAWEVVGRKVPLYDNCQWLAAEDNPFLNCYRPVLARYSVVTEGACSSNPLGILDQGLRFCVGLPDVEPYNFKNGIKKLPPAIKGYDHTVFGFLINPISGERYQFSAEGSWADLAKKNVRYEVKNACFELSGRKASLAFDLDKPEPTLTFEDPAC